MDAEPINNMTEEYPESSESFYDIAKICLKKKNKGPFDQVIASLYRYKKLVDYLKNEKDLPKQEDKLLVEMLTKGLHYKNFQEFKEENIESTTFGFLSTINNSKEFIKYLQHDTKNIKTTFLELIKGNLKEHEEGLLFLKNIIDKQIKEKEKQEKLMKKQQAKDGNLTI